MKLAYRLRVHICPYRVCSRYGAKLSKANPTLMMTFYQYQIDPLPQHQGSTCEHAENDGKGSRSTSMYLEVVVHECYKYANRNLTEHDVDSP